MAWSWLAQVAVGLYVLAYAVLAGFSVVWVVNGGEMAAYKPASWISRLLFWHGVFVMGSLILSAAVWLAAFVGAVVMGGL